LVGPIPMSCLGTFAYTKLLSKEREHPLIKISVEGYAIETRIVDTNIWLRFFQLVWTGPYKREMCCSWHNMKFRFSGQIPSDRGDILRKHAVAPKLGPPELNGNRDQS